MFKRRFAFFIIAFGVWCLLNWVPDWQHIVAGCGIALLVTLMTGDLFVYRPHYLLQPVRYVSFIFEYVPLFIWEVMKANIDVAYRILHPRLLINPGIVKVKTTLRSDTALTFLANSITLTPGTVVVDVNKEKGVLYVHWIDVKSTDVEVATKIIVERFEKILKKIFE